MIREFIIKTLNRFDASMILSRQLVASIRINLEIFNHLAYKDVTAVAAEIAKADPRVTTEERNKGFYINFNGVPLFRIGLNAFTDRSELVVDGQPVLKYWGGEDPTLYDKKHKGHFHNAVLSTFAVRMNEVLEKEMDKL